MDSIAIVALKLQDIARLEIGSFLESDLVVYLGHLGSPELLVVIP